MAWISYAQNAEDIRLRRKRLAFFHPTFAVFGGAELLLASQAQHMRRMGHDVCVVTDSWDRSRWEGPLEGISLRFANARTFTDTLRELDEETRTRLRGERACRSMLDRDIVVAMNFPCNAQLGASDLAAKKVWYCNEPPREHHLVEANPRLYGHLARISQPRTGLERLYTDKLATYRRRIERKKRVYREREFDIAGTRRLDQIIAISEFTRENAARTYGVEPEAVVPPIVRFPSPGRSRTGIDRARPSILVHSRLETVKNVEIVLRAFADFRRHHPSAILHVVGEGQASKELQSLARRLELSAATHFHGFLSQGELSAVYDACDVFALLPIDEPFGMVFPEAAARGLLIVGPDHGGPMEILDGGKLGWLCDPFSQESVVDAFERVFALSDAEADERRNAADAACKARYSENVAGPQLERAVIG